MTAAAPVDGLEQLDLGLVEVHRSNPRKDMGDLTELAASIKEVGVVEPIVVVRRNGHFEAVAGSRRLAAAKKAGLKQIPARVMDLDEAKAAAIALIENLQRKDLNPLEEAQGYADYIALTGCQQKELAEKVGRAPSTVANALRLLEAPKPVKEALAAGTITAAHARVALELKDPSAATKLQLRDGLTVQDLKLQVNVENSRYGLVGQGAVDAAKSFLDRAKKEHPKATITWKNDRYSGGVVDLEKALGKPPFAWTGQLQGERSVPGSHPTQAQHAKVCDCHVLQITAHETWAAGGSKVRFELERVCSVEKKYRTATPPKKRSAAARAGSKPLTEAQQAKLERDRKERLKKQITKAFAVQKPNSDKYRPLYARLAKGSLTADLARAYLAAEIIDYGITGVGTAADDAAAEAWAAIAAMPAKTLTALAASYMANRLEALAYGAEWVPVLEYFGVKAPASKKAAKR